MLRQPLLQPRDGVDVEVVGGFVEHEHRLGVAATRGPDVDERPRQRYGAGLATPTAKQRCGRVGRPARVGRAPRRPPSRRRPRRPRRHRTAVRLGRG